MKYTVKFERRDLIEIHEKGKFITRVVIPPITEGIDIINFGTKAEKEYTFDFGGMVVITTKSCRKIYHKGQVIAEYNNK